MISRLIKDIGSCGQPLFFDIPKEGFPSPFRHAKKIDRSMPAPRLNIYIYILPGLPKQSDINLQNVGDMSRNFLTP